MPSSQKFISHEQFFTFYKDEQEKYRYLGATKEDSNSLELKLKSARQQLGLRQTDLNGLTQSEVSKIESRKDIKISTLMKYAQALGVELKVSFQHGEESIIVCGE